MANQTRSILAGRRAPAAWLCMAVSGRRQHGGNDGYDDVPSSHYSWDSTVPNHAALKDGHAIVLWDKEVLLGCSIIERIDTATAIKHVHKCPYCALSGIKARSTKRPWYKCYKCKGEFDDPTSGPVEVTTFRSRHPAAWVDLAGVLSGTELRQLAMSPESQLSLRPFRWEDFEQELRIKGVDGLRIIDAFESMIIAGHGRAFTRVRIGQAKFRQHLLNTFGPTCAFTGRAPVETLDACHLYSYATVGEHDSHGGMLLRKDIHRLFDEGLLAVHPVKCIIDVAPQLRVFETYGTLHGLRLQIDVSHRMKVWLGSHWTMHRSDTAAAEASPSHPKPSGPC
jgi:ribosomal protein L37AE/L43A